MYKLHDIPSKSRRGASLFEYSVVLGLIGAAAISTILSVGREVQTVFGEAGAAIYSEMNQDPLDPDAFALVLSGSSATIYPMAGGAIEVDWGDRNANERCGNVFTAGGAISCEYDLPGTYRVSIIGDMTAYGDEAGLETNSGISRVLQWGNTGLTSLSFAFYGASSLTDVPANIPSTVSDLTSAFSGAIALNDSDLASWDTSSVELFRSLFEDGESLNVDLGSWDVSSGTNFYRMFYRALQFDQDLNSWDVSNGTVFQAMFRQARSFTRDLSSWDTSSATTMQAMFMQTDYNGSIESWDTSSLENSSYMFDRNRAFDRDISSWDVSKVTDFKNMLSEATSFSQDISSWDVSSAVDMTAMMQKTSSFLGDLSSWCVPGIPTTPSNFSVGSSMVAEPVWGTCP